MRKGVGMKVRVVAGRGGGGWTGVGAGVKEVV